MKKSVWIVLAALLLTFLTSIAQDNGIGLRFGGGTISGAEVTFQTPLWGQRLEADLGWGGNSKWSYVNATGLYQWVFPIEHGFKWYIGLGPTVGNWVYRGDNDDKPSAGFGIGLALNGGAEYNFPEIPLQVSLDTRPTLNMIDVGDSGWFGLAASVRYKF